MSPIQCKTGRCKDKVAYPGIKFKAPPKLSKEEEEEEVVETRRKRVVITVPTKPKKYEDVTMKLRISFGKKYENKWFNYASLYLLKRRVENLLSLKHQIRGTWDFRLDVYGMGWWYIDFRGPNRLVNQMMKKTFRILERNFGTPAVEENSNTPGSPEKSP